MNLVNWVFRVYIFAQRMWASLKKVIFVVFLVCSMIVLINFLAFPSKHVRNEPLSGGEQLMYRKTSGYTDKQATDKNALVALVVTGGGSRSANYSLSVMSELDKMGVLSKVSTISSVSGGSLASAYLVSRTNNLETGLWDGQKFYDQRKEFWANTKEDLSKGFRDKWVKRLFRPDKLPRTLVTEYTRTDIMSEVFDNTLFNNITYGEVYSAEVQPPQLIVNATAINNFDAEKVIERDCTNRGLKSTFLKGEGVSFNEQFFKNCLNSDFSSFPLSTAVAASAAFPGVYSSVTLTKYDRDKENQYLHVVDGGPSDNFGIDSVETVLRNTPGIDSCLIIAVDAYVRGNQGNLNNKSDLRGVLDKSLVDTNVLDAFDALLIRSRYNSLGQLGITPIQQQDMFGGLLDIKNQKTDQLEYSILRQQTRFREILPEEIESEETIKNRKTPKVVPPLLVERCSVWHIALDNIESLMLGKYVEDNKTVAVKSPDEDGGKSLLQWYERDEVAHRINLWNLMANVKTDFNLVGPEECSDDALSDLTWEAGRVSVRDDYESREKVCQWFRARHWSVNEYCDALPVARAPLSTSIVNQSGNNSSRRSVTCK